MPDYKFDFDELDKRAREATTMFDVLKRFGYEVEDTQKHQTCPSCGGKAKFYIKEDYCSCRRITCDLNFENFPTGKGSLEAYYKYHVSPEYKIWHSQFLFDAGVISGEELDFLLSKAEEKSQSPPPSKPKPKTKPGPESETVEKKNNDAPEKVSDTKDESAESKPGPPENSIEPDEEPTKKRSNPWDMLFEMLTLSDHHHAELKIKRGFSDETIREMNYRSSVPENRQLIEQVMKCFPHDDLIECGMLQAKNGKVQPQPQLCGWTMTGKKDDEGNPVWENKPNILIPYRDICGDILFIRPHKGQFPRAYIPTEIDRKSFVEPYGFSTLRKFKHGYNLLVITEGEFKRDALIQAGIPAIAIPGISMMQNEEFRTKILTQISRTKFREFVIIFDNETKSDPKLPGFKKEFEKRWDVFVYSVIIAEKLTGYRRIGMLPDEWLDEEGKADFDNILGRLVAESGSVSEGTAKAKAIFQKAIDEAEHAHKFIKRFPPEVASFIQQRAKKLTSNPGLKVGTYDEQEFARKIRIVDPQLADAFERTFNVYYERRSDKLNRTRLPKMITDQIKKIEKAESDPSTEAGDIRFEKWKLVALTERLKGIPEPASNFYLKGLHALQDETKSHSYFCEAHMAANGRKIFCTVSAGDLSSLQNFSKFAIDQLGGAWMGGQDFRFIPKDLQDDTAFSKVTRVTAYGYHEDSDLWFFGDVAYGPAGERIYPDEYLVYDYKGEKYQVERDPRNPGVNHTHGRPMLLDDCRSKSSPGELFRSFADDLVAGIGGQEAMGMLGIMMGYFAMPEFFKQYGKQHPGLFCYGIFGGGKSTVMRMLMRIFGFPLDITEVKLTPDTTDVGIARSLTHYCNLPVFFDEFKNDYMDQKRIGLVRSPFDRSAALKGTFDGSKDVKKVIPETTPIVSGETQANDSATQSRYFHCLIAEQRRQPDPGRTRFTRMKETVADLHSVGKMVLENRQTFCERFMASFEDFRDHCREWNKGETLSERIMIVHAVAFAGFDAANAILNAGYTPKEIFELCRFLSQYTAQAESSAKSDNPTERFLRFAQAGIAARQVTFYRSAWVNLKEEKIVSESDPNGTFVLAFAATPFYEEVAAYVKKGDASRSFLLQDTLTRYMTQEEYFKGRMGMRVKQQSMKCWILDPSLMPDPEFWTRLAQDGVDSARRLDQAEMTRSDRIENGLDPIDPSQQFEDE